MVLRDKKIIFLLPSKTGSSSLTQMFKGKGIDFELCYGHKHPFLSEVLKYNKISDFYNYKIYQLCRNPIDRLVSAYYFQRQIIEQKEKYKDFFNLDFNQFVKLVTSNTHHLPDHVNKFCYNVFQDIDFGKYKSPNGYGVRFYLPQVKWNDVGMKIKYIKLEDISKDCSILSEILDTEVNFELPKVNITKDKTDQPYISLYNSKSLELVKNTYKEDFKILQYEPTT
jgi:hypothetical protein